MATSSIEIIDLRHLLPAAMEALLADEGRVWERDLLWDYSSTAGMLRRFLDGRALAGSAAIETRQATWFSSYVYEAGKGLVADLSVRPDFRRDAVYSMLLTSTLETLEANPAVRRVEAQLLHADTAAVRSLFVSRGYSCY